MRIWIFLLFLLLASPASAIHPCDLVPTSPECQFIPSDKTGRLIIFESDGMHCSLYINEDGMASGAGGISCVPWPTAGEFKLLRVVKTQNTE